MGIEKKNFKTIFEIFDKKEDANALEFQGTGLGLSINKKMAKLMDGDILLESEPSKGSTFTLVLNNVEIVLESECHHELDDSEIDFSLIKPEGANIMIIDEPQESRAVVIDSFEGTNVKVYHYNNPREAIEVLKTKEMDLLFVDLDLLTSDESAVSKVIAKISKAPVVTLTSRVLKDVVFASNGVRVVGHIKKPMSKIDLFKMTLKLLNSQDYLKKYNKKESAKNDFFSSMDVKKAKEFASLLDNKINIYFNDAQKTNDLTSIKAFAQMLLEISTTHKMQVFIDFANELLEKIDLFDIGAISNLMDEYKVLLNSLQSQT
jgi:CheY-like chemotaxis protein